MEKEDKEKINETEEKSAPKNQLKKEKKIFLIIVLMMVGFAALFGAVYLISDSFNHLNVEEVKFTVDKTTMTGMTLYRTSLPVTVKGTKADYNFWLRGNPDKTNKIPFNGSLEMMKNVVLNQTENFNCNGDGIIGVANLLKLYSVLGANVISDSNATCDAEGRYVFINIKHGNETRIDQIGKACYEIQVNNCEILPATERFMIENLIETNKYLEEN
jgi:hypothetical protein